MGRWAEGQGSGGEADVEEGGPLVFGELVGVDGLFVDEIGVGVPENE